MTRDEFESIKEFAGRLAELRHQVADGQLLDRCEEALHNLIEAYVLADEENETRFPPHKDEVVPPEPAHIEEEELPSGMFETREPPAPPTPPSEPKHEVRHPHQAATHKRPTPRKTRR